LFAPFLGFRFCLVVTPFHLVLANLFVVDIGGIRAFEAGITHCNHVYELTVFGVGRVE
jgi:hypothetical protein